MKPACAIAGCNRPSHVRGWCNSHYKRWWRHGDPLSGGIDQGAPLKWLESVALTVQTDECIDWPFGKCVGYGSIRINGRTEYTHRFICLRAHGNPPSENMEAAHGCGNSSCCNPRHLRWATVKQNSADKRIHGTQPVGEQVGGSRFKEHQILEMRRLRKAGLTYQVIADRFHHDIGATRRIIIGETWAHLPL